MRIIRTTLCYVLIAALAGCASLGAGLEPPRVQLTAVDLLETQALSQRFRLGLTLLNPNSVALPIRGLTYNLALNGVEVAQGASGNVPEIPAYSETELELEATASFVSALRLLNQLLNSESDQPVSYTLSAKIDVEGWMRPVRVTEKGEVPVR